MADFYMGTIILGGWNFAPRQTSFCNGSLIPISQNTALFALLGTTYGGNGQTTFALPDLRGRVPRHWGQGPGLSSVSLGQAAGAENTTLISANMPAHNHTATFANNSSMQASDTKATDRRPTANAYIGRSFDLATVPTQPAIYAPAGSGNLVNLSGLNVAGTVSVGVTGASVPFNNVQPYLGINFCIVQFGIFPSRS